MRKIATQELICSPEIYGDREREKKLRLITFVWGNRYALNYVYFTRSIVALQRKSSHGYWIWYSL